MDAFLLAFFFECAFLEAVAAAAMARGCVCLGGLGVGFGDGAGAAIGVGAGIACGMPPRMMLVICAMYWAAPFSVRSWLEVNFVRSEGASLASTCWKCLTCD
jgi:hypothetical protein